MNSVPADAQRCPNCGYNGTQQNQSGSLPIGFRLQSRYVVGMRRGEDGDSISYIGFDCTLNKPVEIREFMPHNGCTRDPETNELRANRGAELHYKTSLMDFCELYKNLRKIEGNPGIIRTSDFFEANATAYAVLDVFDGITLREFLSMAGGTISSEQTIKLLEPVFNAVESIHAVNLIHRGISPETIFVNRNGDVRLGGFATSQVRTRGTEVANRLYSGYAAPEQYATTMWQSTATDVYALAAVFYRCVTGITPQDADQRRGYDTLEPISRVKPELSAAISRAISVAMLINAQERTQYIAEFLSALKNQSPVPGNVYESRSAVGAGDPDGDDEEQPKKKRNKAGGYPQWIQSLGVRNFWILVAVVALLVISLSAVMIATVLNNRQPQEPEEPVVEMYEVPNYINFRISEVQLDRDKFTYKIEDVYEKGEVNMIVRQTPDPGTEVEPMSEIVLYVNRGERISMPDLIGKTAEKAKATLDELGIPYEIIEEVTDAYAPGVVIKQSIKEGEQVDPTTQKVRLTVSRQSDTADPGEDVSGVGIGPGVLPNLTPMQKDAWLMPDQRRSWQIV